MVAFIERYVIYYSAYAPDPETQHLMDEYWEVGMAIISYLKGHERILGRKQFKKVNMHLP